MNHGYGTANCIVVDDDMIPSVLFGQMRPETIQGLTNINTQLAQLFPTSPIVVQAVQAFNTAVALDNSWAVRQAQAVVNNQQYINVIVPVTTLSEFQNASDIMQHWITVHPDVNARILAGTLNGYGRDVVTKDFYYEDYLKVVDGLMLPITESGKSVFDMHGYEHENYRYIIDLNRSAEEKQQHDGLTFTDRRSILETWFSTSHMLKQGIDFTDPELESE